MLASLHVVTIAHDLVEVQLQLEAKRKLTCFLCSKVVTNIKVQIGDRVDLFLKRDNREKRKLVDFLICSGNRPPIYYLAIPGLSA